MLKTFIVALTLSILLAAISFALNYTQDSIIVIQWNDGITGLIITEPVVNGEISDTTDYYIEPSQGPSQGIIDADGNIIFSSYDFAQLKIFNNKGALLSDLMATETPIKSRLLHNTISEMCVDDLGQLYIIGFPGLPIVPIIDYNGTILDSLIPFDSTLGFKAADISLNPNGKIIIAGKPGGFFTCDNKNCKPGGSVGFIANDGNYYSAFINDSTLKLSINRYTDPDSLAHAKTSLIVEAKDQADSMCFATVLKGGDGSKLFIDVAKYCEGNIANLSREVWVFDLDYRLLDKVIFPQYSSKYDKYIDPFVTRDGSIYEFRCLDDGLHVIKWSKK